MTWSLLLGKGNSSALCTLSQIRNFSKRRGIIFAFYIWILNFPKYLFPGVGNVGSPSVTTLTGKQGWKKRGGRTEEKEIKGWINSPTAASCSLSFWNICHRRRNTGRDGEKVKKGNELQKRWRETKKRARKGEDRERERKYCMNHSFLYCVQSTCVWPRKKGFGRIIYTAHVFLCIVCDLTCVTVHVDVHVPLPCHVIKIYRMYIHFCVCTVRAMKTGVKFLVCVHISGQ